MPNTTQGVVSPASAGGAAAKRRPVHADPSVHSEWDDDRGIEVYDGVGWALSWGCQLSIAYDADADEHYVCVSTSDADQRNGITSRRVTKEQVAAFGWMLVEQFGEPAGSDPCAADRLREERNEFERRALLRLEQLTEVRQALGPVHGKPHAGGTLADRVRELRDELIKANSAAENDLMRLRQQHAKHFRELCDALGVGSRGTLWESVLTAVAGIKAERDRLRSRLDEHLADENSAQATSDRLADEIARIADLVGVPGARAEAVRSAVEGYLFELDQRQGERDEARAERDSLRAKADLAADREKIAAERDAMANALVEITKVLKAVDRQLWQKQKPAEPRRWVVGDDEPEVGTTIAWGSRVNAWKRDTDGTWKTGSCRCEQCSSVTGLTWDDLLAYAPLVEVVSTDD